MKKEREIFLKICSIKKLEVDCSWRLETNKKKVSVFNFDKLNI